MIISLSTTAPSMADRLTPSDQKLTAQPMSDAAKQALLNATPAAVYYPSEPPKTSIDSMAVVETMIGPPQSWDFPRVAELHRGVTEVMRGAFKEFQSALSYLYPDLADKKFGFTVAEDGSLKALNTGGQLNAAEMDRLNGLLNNSSDLKAAALNYRDSAIDLVEADSAWTGSYLGRYNLTKENFADTLDLAALLIPVTKTPSQEQFDGMFFNQMAYKGERASAEVLAAREEARAAKRIVETA